MLGGGHCATPDGHLGGGKEVMCCVGTIRESTLFWMNCNGVDVGGE